MPSWTASPDVRFDHAAAGALRTAIAAAREAVEATGGRVRPAAEAALDEWRGGAAERADDAFVHHLWALDVALETLDALDAEMLGAIETARREQQHRLWLRRMWWLEAEAEANADAEARADLDGAGIVAGPS